MIRPVKDSRSSECYSLKTPWCVGVSLVCGEPEEAGGLAVVLRRAAATLLIDNLRAFAEGRGPDPATKDNMTAGSAIDEEPLR